MVPASYREEELVGLIRIIAMMATTAALVLAGCNSSQTSEEETSAEEVGLEETTVEESASSTLTCDDVRPEVMQELVSDASPEDLAVIRECNAQRAPDPEQARANQREAQYRQRDRQAQEILNCQLTRATGGDQQEADVLFDEVFAEAMERGGGVSVQDILAERGYDCGWASFRQSEGR